jgi:hypothetical protein
MQTDWGGEYERLNFFFQQIGITHRVSCPHAHQQNGAAERKHRHIVEVGLALLANASMPLNFWDEAFLTATRLINYLPSKVVGYKMPTELLLKEIPDYSSLRVFGCACWPNLRPFNSKKLEFCSKWCSFLGYSSLHKGFKCLDIPTGRVYISRDVIFDEEVFHFATLHSNAGARLRHEISLLPENLLGSHHGVAGSDDQYFANNSSNGVTSDVINKQDESGDEQEESEKNSEEHGVPGTVHQRLLLPPLRDLGVESRVDPPGIAVEGDSISLRSGVVLSSDEGARGSPGKSQSGTRGVLGQGTAASSPGDAGSSADGGSAAASTGSSAPTAAAEPEVPRAKTRSQSVISKPKVYTDGTIRYANFSSTG